MALTETDSEKPTSNTIIFHVQLPLDLHKRAQETAKKLSTRIAQLIRDGLTEKLDAIDAKRRASEEARLGDKMRGATGARAPRFAVKPLGSTNGQIAPLGAITSNVAGGTAEARASGRSATSPKISAIYENYARQILAAKDDAEIKRLVVLAVSAVKRECPLTHPGDDGILVALEAAVVKMRDQPAAAPAKPSAPATGKATRSYDTSVGAIVNATKVKTKGDVIPDEETEEE